MNDRTRPTWILFGEAIGAAGFCLLSGCALTSKSEPMNPRYFDLDQARVSAGSTANGSANADTSRPERLRLGQIEAAEHLDERLVFRSRAQEIGYYEGQRWSERPREYLRRALSRELYERRGLTRVVSGPAPTLEVELSSFEEVRDGGSGLARVRLTYVLHDEESVRIERTLTVDRPVRASPPRQRSAAVVAAMAEALQDAVLMVAQQVTGALPSMQGPVADGNCPPATNTNAGESSEERPRALDTP